MIYNESIILINKLGEVDPGPFFILSLLPYLLFLYWLNKVEIIPKIAIVGFRFTLLFVFITIICAIIAKLSFGGELTDVDPLHGLAESFLTLSDTLVVIGFLRVLRNKEIKNS
tara:strand:+ start:190 stop:528 length:339 start_codon:yes stop_codon:yes gene_type:complete